MPPGSQHLLDCIVVGGGIVGCATARNLKLARPRWKITLVEKESVLAQHQSGHNSGVIHAGVYYTPGSLRARLCVDGSRLVYDYLAEKGIAHRRCGKLIVAVTPDEVPRLRSLFERAQQNGCDGIELVDERRIAEIEPLCRGLEAIWSPNTGIVDWAQVARSYAEDFVRAGGEVRLNWRLAKMVERRGSAELGSESIRLEPNEDTSEPLETRYVITCAGLYSDKVAELTGGSSSPRIVPFRGEYLEIRPERRHQLNVSTNIYPVPDPKLPFLGVHITPTIDGRVLLGPNALLAAGREAYARCDVDPKELASQLAFAGMRRLVLKNLKFGLAELYRGLYLPAQVRQLQRYVPALQVGDVVQGPAGIRAQALSDTGELVDDFVFETGGAGGQSALKRVLHVRNAPSPGATSSMAIAKTIVEHALRAFNEDGGQ